MKEFHSEKERLLKLPMTNSKTYARYHTRHRSWENFFSNIIGGLTAYTFLLKKPSINVKFEPMA